MKQQIIRFSPHQNAKVIAVLMAVSSLIFLVPMFVLIALNAPPQARPPMMMLAIMPVIYLVFGYIAMVILCAVYNVLSRYVGGIEFESTTEVSDNTARPGTGTPE